MKTIKIIRQVQILLCFFLMSSIHAQEGKLEAENGIVIGNTTAPIDGTIRFTGSDFEGRIGSSWLSLVGGGAGSSPWSTNGSNIYFNTGRVGIGLTNPAVPLQVNASGEVMRLQGASPFITLRDVNASLDAILQYQEGAQQLRLGTFSSSDFSFITNNTEKMNINANGNIGIGTNLPTARLEIVDNSSTTSGSLALIENDNDDFSRLFFQNSSNATDKWSLAGIVGPSVDHKIGFFYNGNPRLVYSENDEGLGIGTSNPNESVHVKFSGSGGMLLEGDGTGDARIWLSNTGGGHFIFDDVSNNNSMAFQSANEMAFYTDGFVERMRIDDLGGEIGVNTAPNTNYRFRVNATNDLYSLAGVTTNQQAIRGTNNHVGSGAAYAVYGTVGSAATGNKYGIYGFVSNNATGGNKYGVYGTSDASDANSWGVYSNGDFWYTGTISGPSDERLKKNIKDLEPVLDKVLQVQTKSYEFDREKFAYANLAEGEQIGFIAQNVKSLFPSLVDENTHAFITRDEEGEEPETQELDIMGINSIGMIPVLTKAIQEQQAMIEAQQKQIDALIQLVQSEK